MQNIKYRSQWYLGLETIMIHPDVNKQLVAKCQNKHEIVYIVLNTPVVPGILS